MSSLPRSTGSFKRLRVVRLVSQLFRRRRRTSSGKQFGLPSLTISAPYPVSANFATMSLILHCRYLRASHQEESLASSPASSTDDIFREVVFPNDDDLDRPCDEENVDLDEICRRTQSHESIFQQQDFRPRKMIRISRGLDGKVDRNPRSLAPSSDNSSSLMDISNAALRSELESKMFVRAKRLNSGTNDPSFASRVRADSAPHPMSGSTNYDSNSSMLSFLSNSDLNLERSSVFSLVRNETTTHSTSEGRLEKGRDAAFQAILAPPTNHPLSHEAAKHRIAIKPKNRRPQTFHPIHSEPIFEKSLEKFSDYTSSTGTGQQATVLSEVQATYEFLKRSPEARQPQPVVTQEQTVRKASSTMTYSKSFHLPRRPSGDSVATPIVASPRLSRYNFSSGQGPPPVPPKLFNTNTDEFKNVFSKFRKHVEPDPVASNWQESNSRATSTTPFTVTSTFPFKANFSTDNSESDARDTNDRANREEKRTDALNDNNLTAATTGIATATTPSNIPFRITPLVNPLPETRIIDRSFTRQSEPVQPTLMSLSMFSTNTHDHSENGSEIRKTSIAKSENLFESKFEKSFSEIPTLLTKPGKSENLFESKSKSENLFESKIEKSFSEIPSLLTKSVISPKPAPRTRLAHSIPSSQVESKAELELRKVLAKRIANLETDKNQTETVESASPLTTNTNSVNRNYSFKEKETASSINVVNVKKDFSSRRSVFCDVPILPRESFSDLRRKSSADKENQPVSDPTPIRPSEPIKPLRSGTSSSHLKQDFFRDLEEELKLFQPSTQNPQPFRSIFLDPPANFPNDIVSHRNDPVVSQRSDPVASHRSDPVAFYRNEPVASHRSDPVVSQRSDPVASHQSDPVVFHRNEPVVSHRSDPETFAAPASAETYHSSSDVCSSKLTARENFDQNPRKLERQISSSFNHEKNPQPFPQEKNPSQFSETTKENENGQTPLTVSSRAAMFQQKFSDFKPLSPRNSVDQDRNRVVAPPLRVPLKNLQTASFEEIVKPEPQWSQPVNLRSVLKPTTTNNQVSPSSTWTSSVPQVPLKPVSSLPMKPKVNPVSAQVSCGNLTSTVPAWVALAQEKRKRIGLLSGSSDIEGDQVAPPVVNAM